MDTRRTLDTGEGTRKVDCRSKNHCRRYAERLITPIPFPLRLTSPRPPFPLRLISFILHCSELTKFISLLRGYRKQDVVKLSLCNKKVERLQFGFR